LRSSTCNTAIKPESPLADLCKEKTWVRQLILATLFGALTALSAQVHIRIPWSPVPVTGQVFMVLLAGGLLGARWGAVSQLQYIAFGLMGLPVFAGGTSGLIAFAGPTGGYLVGFVAAAFLVGLLAQRFHKIWQLIPAAILGVAIIYLFGWIWLSGWLGIVKPDENIMLQAFSLGVLPFVWLDMAKALVAANIIAAFQKSTG